VNATRTAPALRWVNLQRHHHTWPGHRTDAGAGRPRPQVRVLRRPHRPRMPQAQPHPPARSPRLQGQLGQRTSRVWLSLGKKAVISPLSISQEVSHLGLVAGPESCWTELMSRRVGDGDGPVVPPVPGALGLPAVPAGRPARRKRTRLARTLRTRWWPRFLLTGVLVVVVGATVVSSAAAPWVILAGAAIIFVVACSALASKPSDYRREGPVPPGAPGPS